MTQPSGQEPTPVRNHSSILEGTLVQLGVKLPENPTQEDWRLALVEAARMLELTQDGE